MSRTLIGALKQLHHKHFHGTAQHKAAGAINQGSVRRFVQHKHSQYGCLVAAQTVVHGPIAETVCREWWDRSDAFFSFWPVGP